jgi:hypothetical protein
MTTRRFSALIGLFILVFGLYTHVRAEDKIPACTAMDRPCLLKQIEILAASIDKQEWKDQTYRELAKTYAYEGQADKAIALISKIVDNDTKAMTIRGIGMAAASLKWSNAQYRALFIKLSEQAALINHPPSQGIAYTAGVPPVAAAMLVAQGIWNPQTMVNVEELDPDPLIALLDKIGLPTVVEDRTPK